MKKLLFTPLKLLTYFLVLSALSALFWVERNFGIPGVDQLLYHIVHAGEMPLTADRELVESFALWIVLLPLVAAVALTWIDRGLTRRIRARRADSPRLLRVWSWRAPALVMATTVFLMNEVSAFSYLANLHSDSDYFADNYIPPLNATLSPGEPKNLVLIYLESVEATYGDAELFGRNLLGPLAGLPGVSFDDFQQMPGTSWTMGGLVGSQCGVPLKNVFLSARDWNSYGLSYGINEVGEMLARFLPGAVCLSDILDRYGYTNVFVGGASLGFAGKGTFLRDHAYHQAYGREELLAAGVEPELNSSGFYDDAVFAFAKAKFKELHAAGRPFNLTLLTMDAHGPDGFISRACAERGATTFTDIIDCTAAQAAEFVRFIVDSGYLADTRVVILGDHLAMRNPVYEILEQAPRRTIFNRFIADVTPTKNRETIVHFDLLPTILDFVGLRVDSGRLALGHTALGPLSEPLPEERLAQLQDELPKRSKAYLTLWHAAPAVELAAKPAGGLAARPLDTASSGDGVIDAASQEL